MHESKEKIISRMIKNASKLWGFQDTQAESSFDPLVSMILGALSVELAKISSEINTTEARLLERLVELLTPEPVTGPLPSHGLIRANPVESVFTIDPDYQFYVNKKFTIPGEKATVEKQVYFTPTGNFKLFNGQVKNLVAGGKIYEYQTELYKEMIAPARHDATFRTSELWIGLKMDDAVESMKGLTVCFDLRSEVYDNSFYESLAKGSWTINGQTVKFVQGTENEDDSKADTLEMLLKNELDLTTKVCNHINRYYHKNFLTLASDDLTLPQKESGEKYPARFNELFLPNDLDKLEGNLLWIKAEFPQVLPADIFDNLFCSINCFPVFNRHLNEFTQSSREIINIIPLITEEIFLDMKRVTSTNGKLYVAKTFSGINEVENGTYILRNGGVGRFDSRNAAEILNYLLELLRDESAAFAILGADMISSNLKELNQTITRLENRLKEGNIVKEEISYLLLKTHPADEILFVEFWSTNGTFANNIKSGENLLIYDGSNLWPESVVMVKPTLGGRESLDTEQRINAYRKALLSHGRVVTKEDIKALCFEHFGNRLKQVEIKRGLQIGQSTDSGFMQTLDIYLTPAKPCSESEKAELEYLKKDLLIKLEEQSANVLPFRCFFTQKTG
jgi:hypothetical protein